MSTSTWTTTTSATGMPTLELEPCRVRSSSFRHSRDTTPGSSPQESRSNSPSPSSPTVVLTIPKSRSFSLTAQPTSMTSHLKRLARKSVIPTASDISSKPEKISPLVKAELDSSAEDRLKVSALHKEHLSSIRKMNVTSDYESCNESPSSSDHSDNILTSDEMSSGSPPKKVINRVVSIVSLQPLTPCYYSRNSGKQIPDKVDIWWQFRDNLSHLMRLWHFSSSVNTFFKCTCAAIQWH